METRMLAVSVSPGLGGAVYRPEQLRVIASVAAEESFVEMTPFRQLYVTVEDSRAEAAEKRLSSVGLTVLPSGFYTKNLQACNFCKGTETAGLDLALKLDATIAGLPVPTPVKVGYAGCALGTSEPLTKEIAVVKMRSVYDNYVGGDAKGIKPVFAELLLQGVQEKRVIHVVRKLIEFYVANAKGKEKFRRFVDRITLDRIKETVAS